MKAPVSYGLALILFPGLPGSLVLGARDIITGSGLKQNMPKGDASACPSYNTLHVSTGSTAPQGFIREGTLRCGI